MLLLWIALSVVTLALWVCASVVTRQRDELIALRAELKDLRKDWAETTILAAEAKTESTIAHQIAAATCRYAFTPIGKQA